jgi:hypothetical protein
MNIVNRITSAAVFTATTISCGGAGGTPAATPAAPTAPSLSLNLAGAWTGTGVDSGGATVVTWTLVQSGASVSGTVATRAVDPTDGSCNSCHRNKLGTLSGTISGAALTLSMDFAAGVSGDPTPICSSAFAGTSPDIAASAARVMTVAYSGADSCEGPLANGALTMTRTP